jgi:hypothetical protein
VLPALYCGRGGALLAQQRKSNWVSIQSLGPFALGDPATNTLQCLIGANEESNGGDNEREKVGRTQDRGSQDCNQHEQRRRKEYCSSSPNGNHHSSDPYHRFEDRIVRNVSWGVPLTCLFSYHPHPQELLNVVVCDRRRRQPQVPFDFVKSDRPVFVDVSIDLTRRARQRVSIKWAHPMSNGFRFITVSTHRIGSPVSMLTPLLHCVLRLSCLYQWWMSGCMG